MKKILVAYDGGELGDRALSVAADLAHAFGCHVDIVSVVPEGFARIPGQAEQPAITHARKLVDARARLRERGVDAGLIEPAGEPAATIEGLCTERGYDTLIVGGSRAQAAGVPWPQTVTAHVASNAPVTVIVTH